MERVELHTPSQASMLASLVSYLVEVEMAEKTGGLA